MSPWQSGKSSKKPRTASQIYAAISPPTKLTSDAMPEIIINTEMTDIQAAIAFSQLFLSAVRAVSLTTELDAVIINTSFTYTIPLKNEDLITKLLIWHMPP